MARNMTATGFLPVAFLALLGVVGAPSAAGEARAGKPKISVEGEKCLQCHESFHPALVEQWKGTAHPRSRVDCYACHKAREGDPATFEHYMGLKIAVIVTPNYCASCHAQEAKEFAASRHSQGAQFIGSLDNILGEIVEGGPAAAHGRPGPCPACHGRHSFSAALARQPENCGKCHMGPDHPQIEIYNESKHGIQYRGNLQKMNLETTRWVA